MISLYWPWIEWRGWRHEITMGEEFPRGYGLAWRLYMRDAAIVMPVPLNVVAGAVRSAYHWLQHGVDPSVFDEAIYRVRAAERRLAIERTDDAVRLAQAAVLRAMARRCARDGLTDAMETIEALVDDVLAGKVRL